MDETRRAPWKYWVRIADPRTSPEEKLTASTALFAADERTLDSASIRLRRKAGTPETLLQDKWQKFMFHAVNKIPLSTAFVECLFGQYNQWQNKSPKPISVPLLAAKHVAHQFKAGSERKRQRAEDSQRDPDEPQAKRVQPTRPEWVFKRGEMGRMNARHRFMSTKIATRTLGATQDAAFASASQAWRVAPPVAKARAARSARFCRVQAKAAKLARLDASKHERDDALTLWGIGRGSTFPLHPSDFEELQRGGRVAQISKEWTERAGRRELQQV